MRTNDSVSQRIVARANGMALMMLTFLLIIVGGVIWELARSGEQARAMVQHSNSVNALVQELGIAVIDAETGQRGFLLTNQGSYLGPYNAALGRVTRLHNELTRLTVNDTAQQAHLATLAPLLDYKFDEMTQTIHLRRESGFDAALALVRTDVGLRLMDQIRATLSVMRADEQLLMNDRLQVASTREAWVRIAVMAATALTTLAVIGAMMVLNRSWAGYYASEKEQRALVQQLRATLDSLEQGVAVFDADRRLVNWNSEFHRLLDLPRAMVRCGTPYAAFVEHTTDAAGGLLEDEADAPADMRYERARSDGTVLGVRRTSTPSGGFVLVASDLTRPAQADAVLREAQRMRTLGQLTAGIAHDYNNLLTVVLGNLEILAQRLDSGLDLRGRIEHATTAAQHSAALTAKLLRFARREPFTPVTLDMADTILEIIPLLRRTMGEHIDVRYRAEPNLWPVHADAPRLECALLDLALNARDSMPEGGQVTVELANRVSGSAGGGYVSLSVSDTGHGAGSDLLEHAFEPFSVARHDGFTLGLMAVASFAEQSGGYVEVAASATRGTVARLCLPRAIVPLPAAISSNATLPPMPRTSATVLVVDDEPAVREIACAMLASIGCRILEASDGETALRLFGEHAAEVDLLVTDLLLPGRVRGREVAERITAIRPDIQVLFVSGYNQSTMLDHGWDDHARLITKPFTHDQLARAVAEVLADRATRSEVDPSA